MIVELITAGVLSLDPNYDLNAGKARYLQDLVNQAIDVENYVMACEGQLLVTHYMSEAGHPINARMIRDSLELAQRLCLLAEESAI